MPHYIVLDVETTGLDRQRANVIEVGAILLASDTLARISEFRVAVRPVTDYAEPDAVAMHERSGLAADVREHGVTLEHAHTSILEWLAQNGADVDGYRSLILVGNNPAFDRAFVDRVFPMLARCLHYRMVDVSTLRAIAALVVGTSPDLLKKKLATHAPHTALGDCENCLVEFYLYARALASSTLRHEIERFAAEHVAVA